ncbi:MAG: hypothetical protein CMF61_08205 [Magnetococcales bacterium]|nr:hypothetical protein [Magnetococcales bacterium]|tara:strand:- start:14 stop:862 length:849 start_codon:yes stop_codon:yes gene_type:complete
MKILGHRGCILKGKPFQNSLKAFNLAIQYTNGFETDACLTKDGDIAFIHEEITTDEHGTPLSSMPLYLDEASTLKLQKRTLCELSTKEVKTLSLKDGQPIPFFEDIVPLFTKTDKIWNIELKAHKVTPVIIQKLKACFKANTLTPEQIILSSFDHEALKLVKQELPDVKFGALFVAHDHPVERLNPWRDDPEGFYMPLTEQNLTRPLIQALKPQFIIGPHTELNETQINMVKTHYPQAKMCIWVCGEYNNFKETDFDKQIEHFAKQGKLDSIIVDDIIKHKI